MRSVAYPGDRYATGRPPTRSPRESVDIRKSYYPHSSSSAEYRRTVPEHELYKLMHRLPPSEPIYMDLEERKEQSSLQVTREIARARPQTYVNPARAMDTGRSARLEDTPIMFGDPYDGASIGTGMSQQELLRRKAREHSKKGREKKFKKKKKEPIINLPSSLLGGIPIGNYMRSGSIQRDAPKGIKVWGSEKFGSRRLMYSYSRSSDDLDASTAETTNSSNDSRQRSYELPYSSVPVPPAALSESHDLLLIGLNDSKSVGEESQSSFPLLSRTVADFPVRITPHPEPTSLRRTSRVRFADNIATSAPALTRKDSDRPWDECTDDRPTSLHMETPGKVTKRKSTKPKSILREARFSKAARPRRFFSPYERLSLGSRGGSVGESSASFTEQALPADHGFQANSPPRFVDNDGAELSPIRNKWEARALLTHPRFLGHPAEKHTSSYRRKRDKLSVYPDPPLEIAIMDEESVASSRSAFMESVAAVVVQSAIRRYLAIKRYRMTRHYIDDDDQTEESIELGNPAYSLFDLAAIRIQSAFRGFWVRDCLSVDHFCATVIQKAFRGYHYRMTYMFDLFRIIIVQSVWRRALVREYAANVLAYVIVIQAAARGLLVRKAHPHVDRRNRLRSKPNRPANFEPPVTNGILAPRPLILKRSVPSLVRSSFYSAKEIEAATIIQSHWRTFICECAFIRDLVDVLIVQTIARKWLAIRRGAIIRRRRIARLLHNSALEQSQQLSNWESGEVLID